MNGNQHLVADELYTFLTARQAGQDASPPTGLAPAEAALVDGLLALAEAIQPDPPFAADLRARLDRAQPTPDTLDNRDHTGRKRMRTQNFKCMLHSLLILAMLWAPFAQLSRMASASGGDDIRAADNQKMCRGTLADPGFRYMYLLATGEDSLNNPGAFANCKVGGYNDRYNAYAVSVDLDHRKGSAESRHVLTGVYRLTQEKVLVTMELMALTNARNSELRITLPDREMVVRVDNDKNPAPYLANYRARPINTLLAKAVGYDFRTGSLQPMDPICSWLCGITTFLICEFLGGTIFCTVFSITLCVWLCEPPPVESGG